MFRALIPPIFRSTGLCVTAFGIMHPRCCAPVAWKRRNSASRLPAGFIPVHYATSCNTQSSAPEDHSPKHVELIGIIHKPLLLHLVDVYVIYVNGARSSKYQSSIISLRSTLALWQLEITTSQNYVCTFTLFIIVHSCYYIKQMPTITTRSKKHVLDLDAEMYQPYSLRMALGGLQHVGVI